MAANEVPTFCPENQQQWRAWLEEHHDKEKSVWVIFYKNKSGMPTVTWSDAVDEALCFGWIDSTVRPIDEERFMRFFARRKAKSVWSKINKDKVQKLTENGSMTAAGFHCVEIAKQNGSWNTLDDSDALIIPVDLATALQEKPGAEGRFSGLSKSDRRTFLHRLILAKRPETRQKRIAEILELINKNLKS